MPTRPDPVAGGLDPAALVAGAYDTREFKLTPRTKVIFAGGRRQKVGMATQSRIVLPNGHVVNVSVDDSGVATQITENDRQHAIVRPHTLRLSMSREEATERARHTAERRERKLRSSAL